MDGSGGDVGVEVGVIGNGRDTTSARMCVKALLLVWESLLSLGE